MSNYAEPEYYCPDCEGALRAIPCVWGDKVIGRQHECNECGKIHEDMDAYDEAWDYDEDA